MRKYLVLFMCAENSPNHLAWKKLDEDERSIRMRDGNLSLDLWLDKYGDRIEFDGGELGKLTKSVDGSGVREAPSQIGRFIVMRADSSEEAADIFLNHPHFSLFPGDGVEILECQT